ncbi:hypothetical protein PRIPAC_79100 [Pristionchus pacificus]|uniref:Uncharacterized protein n=1 Tax=Pristionchus pacificus TaxID=54126 RepID=A0A2A6BHE1_PRIPA|nr:hypothetical protein PRIPAC_79100 [Pristionchus pacificus]|eukprot:PDM65231.1 hypothetical protein PRIPAC_52173 [Pristionchus pacificus]
MKIFLVLLFTTAVMDGHLISSGLESLNPSELLSSISLSEEITVLLQPENVTEINIVMFRYFSNIIISIVNNLRLLVKRMTTLNELCDGTAKPILCRKTLKWPIRNLQETYADLEYRYEAVKNSGSLNNKMLLSEESAKAKEHLARLENNTVLTVAKSSMHEH